MLREWYSEAYEKGYTRGTYKEYLLEIKKRLEIFYGRKVRWMEVKDLCSEFMIRGREKELSP